VPIREGEMFLLPARVPHNPIRGANTIGMVIERKRRAGEKDGAFVVLRKLQRKLYEEYFDLEDITTQFQGVFKKFYGEAQLRTCKNCGAVMEPPPVIS
jgi:3-hydroxyanthranilate 3,4-dioxygenase